MTRSTLHGFATLALLVAVSVPALADHHGKEGGKPDALLGLEAQRLDGSTESLERYRGEVLLIVNTASRCGYTPQFKGLQALYESYREQGFSILGFPSNDFAGQEPLSDAQIAAFCKKNYGVEFPMFSKVRVKGDGAHPVYVYLTSLPDPVGGPVEWNFQKYLVDRNGKVVARYAPRTSAEDPSLVKEIERLLAEPRPEAPMARLRH
jgi:glutathione peroxidase